MARARIHAPGERGPSLRHSNAGGASAAFRHRPTRKQGLQGLRFAPGSVGKRAESPVSAGLCGMAATRKVRTLMRTWFAGLHPGQTKNGQDRKLNAGAGLQPIRWLGCRNRPTSLCAPSDAADTFLRNSPHACACARPTASYDNLCPMRQTRRGIRSALRNWTPLAADHTTLYTRSPLSLCASTTFRPSFLRSIPEIAPRTVCGCQPVASISWRLVAPYGRRSDLTSAASLVPGRIGMPSRSWKSSVASIGWTSSGGMGRCWPMAA